VSLGDFPDFGLDGQMALVTGASRGIRPRAGPGAGPCRHADGGGGRRTLPRLAGRLARHRHRPRRGRRLDGAIANTRISALLGLSLAETRTRRIVEELSLEKLEAFIIRPKAATYASSGTRVEPTRPARSISPTRRAISPTETVTSVRPTSSARRSSGSGRAGLGHELLRLHPRAKELSAEESGKVIKESLTALYSEGRSSAASSTRPRTVSTSTPTWATSRTSTGWSGPSAAASGSTTPLSRRLDQVGAFSESRASVARGGLRRRCRFGTEKIGSPGSVAGTDSAHRCAFRGLTGR